MADPIYTTLEKEGRAEYTVERSVFIGSAIRVTNESDAVEYIKKIRKEFSDARHNVYAYLIKDTNVTRYSDDGEPQGTAGLPVLDYLRKSGVSDVCVVVTRYFGGILLGKGGLVRAYTECAKRAAEAAGIVSLVKYTEFKVGVPYPLLEKLRYELSFLGVVEDGADYGNGVTLRLAVKEDGYGEVSKKISELTSGGCAPVVTGSRYDKI